MKEYETKEKIFKHGCYLKVYESVVRGWCWLVRLTNYKGTFIGKGSSYKTKQKAEQDMIKYIGGIEPLLYHYKKNNCGCNNDYYKTYVTYSTSYTTKASGLDRFIIRLRFLWCKLFHKKNKFRFHESVEPFIECNGEIYYNVYCSKCWCIKQQKYVKNHLTNNDLSV